MSLFRKHNLLPFLFLILCSILTGCTKPVSHEPISVSDFKLNTIITISIYDSDDTKLLDECLAICDSYELLFSRTNPESEIYRLNHGLLENTNHTSDTSLSYKVSAPVKEVIEKGLAYSKLSDGNFDISVAPLTSLWDFTADSPSVPAQNVIDKVLPLIDHNAITTNENSVTFSKNSMGIDLGAIAKGYIADELKKYLLSQGVKSAMINLGGNVLCIGKKPDGEPFKIGIQKPFADRNETIATIDIADKSVVSSGIYERFFEADGKIYHHILNPRTGYPYENDLIAVTIISDKSVDGDALSTVCFSLGLEKGLKLAERLEDVDAVFITKDYEMHYTTDFLKR